MYLLLQRFFPAIWQCEVLLVISSYYTIQKQMIKISGNSCKQLKNPFLPHPSLYFFEVVFSGKKVSSLCSATLHNFELVCYV